MPENDYSYIRPEDYGLTGLLPQIARDWLAQYAKEKPKSGIGLVMNKSIRPGENPATGVIRFIQNLLEADPGLPGGPAPVVGMIPTRANVLQFEKSARIAAEAFARQNPMVSKATAEAAGWWAVRHPTLNRRFPISADATAYPDAAFFSRNPNRITLGPRTIERIDPREVVETLGHETGHGIHSLKDPQYPFSPSILQELIGDISSTIARNEYAAYSRIEDAPAGIFRRLFDRLKISPTPQSAPARQRGEWDYRDYIPPSSLLQTIQQAKAGERPDALTDAYQKAFVDYMRRAGVSHWYPNVAKAIGAGK